MTYYIPFVFDPVGDVLHLLRSSDGTDITAYCGAVFAAPHVPCEDDQTPVCSPCMEQADGE